MKKLAAYILSAATWLIASPVYSATCQLQYQLTIDTKTTFHFKALQPSE